ncbi:DUF4355 domain-containing protein [bacterium D16-54]|nr:DUF4355 domain-containing protein [bacterium D16-54]RKJ11705.1 DUF4355 domain-containing protein [bacterium D16-56]
MNENINNVQEAAAKEKSIVNGNGQGAVAEAAREEKEMPNQGAASETLDTGQGIEGNPVESQEKRVLQEEQEPVEETGKDNPSSGKKLSDGQDQESREAELQKREERLARRELELDAKAILKEKGISEAMLPYLIRENREETEKCIEAYKAAADAELKARLDERLVGKTPPQPAGQISEGDRTTADVFASALRG